MQFFVFDPVLNGVVRVKIMNGEKERDGCRFDFIGSCLWLVNDWIGHVDDLDGKEIETLRKYKAFLEQLDAEYDPDDASKIEEIVKRMTGNWDYWQARLIKNKLQRLNLENVESLLNDYGDGKKVRARLRVKFDGSWVMNWTLEITYLSRDVDNKDLDEIFASADLQPLLMRTMSFDRDGDGHPVVTIGNRLADKILEKYFYGKDIPLL